MNRISRRIYKAWPALLIFLAACNEKETPQDALDPKGPYAKLVDDLWNFVFPIAVAVFILVQVLVIFVVIKYRRKSDDDAPKQVHGNRFLEITWTILPVIILVVVGVKTVSALVDLDERPTSADTVHVQVVGHQWWWEFAYPKDNDKNVDCQKSPNECVRTANEMVIPAGRPIDVQLRSKDVIHSFWVPSLAGKLDVTSGRTNYMALEADKPGEYFGQCAEFCGLSHANMRFRVKAMNNSDYATWWSGQTNGPRQPTTEDQKAGLVLFETKGCAGCHTINGISVGSDGEGLKRGPNLTHFASRSRFAGSMFENTNKNVRAWLRNPPEEKPGSLMPNLELTESEISQLIAYLESLK